MLYKTLKNVVTGASGFLGRHLLFELLENDQYCVRQVLRASGCSSSPDVFLNVFWLNKSDMYKRQQPSIIGVPL
jgi:NAD dependent epimerase/dehydratase family enzyme